MCAFTVLFMSVDSSNLFWMLLMFKWHSIVPGVLIVPKASSPLYNADQFA